MEAIIVPYNENGSSSGGGSGSFQVFTFSRNISFSAWGNIYVATEEVDTGISLSNKKVFVSVATTYSEGLACCSGISAISGSKVRVNIQRGGSDITGNSFPVNILILVI